MAAILKSPDSKLSIDLSTYSRPINDLFKQPRNAKEWEQYILSEEQISFFKENGYVNGIKILTGEQVDQLNNELIRL